MVMGMSQTRTIRWFMGMGVVMGVTVCWSLSQAGESRGGRAVMGPPTSDMMSAPTTTEAAVRPMPSASVPLESGVVLRTIPTVSKPISVGGMTLLPYLGAGFGGGYATEFDRSLHAAQFPSSASFNAGLKHLFGQQLIPNEVQLGVRFPF